ncbi:protein rotatin homolog [Musca vetustissima]|uniref:protein rotatin homolog n=1 Tax=Musca vetustissima TaxID=27455 RepID=UPI002AB5E47A|nr:protein rotatin homolog [Musca vetustissima]
MSMIQISRSTLQKLTHESLEIRLRALDQIAGKLERALELNEKVDVKFVELCKQLIRWFGFTPIRTPLKVLKLLKSLLHSESYGDRIIQRMGADRLRKECRKIKILLEQQNEELQVVQEILDFLKCCERKAEENKKSDDMEELMRATKRLSIQNKCGSRDDKDEEVYSLEDYEVPWSSPSRSDYTSLKLMADILKNPSATEMELHHALQHLQLTMKDYPAEYMLQAPHIFRHLLQIFNKPQMMEKLTDATASTVYEFLQCLELRLEYRKKSLNFPYAASTIEDCQIEKPSQLRVGKALAQLLESCIDYWEEYGNESIVIWEIMFKILNLYVIIKEEINDNALRKLGRILSKLCLQYTATEQCTRPRLQQMQILFFLQDVASINNQFRPLKSVELYEPILRDYSIKCLYPERYLKLREILWKNEQRLWDKYQLLDKYETSLRKAINLLIDDTTSRTTGVELIKNGSSLVLMLDKIHSKQLLDIIFMNIVESIPHYLNNEELKSKAIQLLIKLLNISFMPLKVYLHERLTNVFKRHIGCLMNGERYLKECENSALLVAGIVGIPLNTHLLLHLLHNGFESADEKIQISCFKILELLLQSQSLFGSKWSTFLPTLVPILPLLGCCTFSKKILELLLKLYDPDSRRLPYVSVLQGNIAFLFHNNNERRSEALTRLLYSLNSLKGSDKYMPNLMHISDTLPNDICMLTSPREYRHIFNDISPLRPDAVSTLNNLFHLLDSPDVEPLIRKTTLMQINVLCSNWHVTGELCNAGASFLILQALENALQNESCLDYPDTAIPCISILNKILFYDSTVRCEIAETPNIYVLLLRALFMFHHDIQVRQDATMCLFQLLFSHQLVATERSVEGPLILGNIHMPFDIYLRSALAAADDSETDFQKIAAIFASVQEENQYWRFVIADASCHGMVNINPKSMIKQSQLDINEDLKLNSQDVKLIRATQPGVSLQRLIRAATNATDHRSLIHACSMLNQQLLLPRLPQTFLLGAESSQALGTMLNKYLQLQPSNDSDLELYQYLVDVLLSCLKIPVTNIAAEFIKILHKDVRHAFITMLTQQQEIELGVYYKISHVLKYLIIHHKEVFESTLSPSESSAFFSNLFDLLMERTLQLFEVRDLQRVRCLLSLLLSLSTCYLDMPDKLLFYYCRRFMQLSLALKSFTQTGSQWHRDCLKSILNLSSQMTESKCNFRLAPGVVKYIGGMCAHIDAQVRILAWSILYLVSETIAIPPEANKKSKSSDNSGSEMLSNELSYLPGGFIACCLSTLLDIKEITHVRQLAGQLFANLIQKRNDIEEIEQIFEQHRFLNFIGAEALNKEICVLSSEVPNGLEPSNTKQITTCGLIACYTRICIEMSLQSPAFLNEICTRSFMFKLYEILKLPLPSAPDISNEYITMIALICRLYTMCYTDNYIFLQRTICRDPIWLDNLCKIVFSIDPNATEPYKIVDMLQLLMVLLKDPNALEHLTTKMLEYSLYIVNMFKHALSTSRIGTMLQRCMLSVLSLLCIKAQPEIGGDLSCNVLLLLNGSNIEEAIADDKVIDLECENKENHINNNNNNNVKRRSKNGENGIKEDKKSTTTISEHLCIYLIRLFTHLYPLKVCKFISAPTEAQQQVVESLSLLLKVSPNAQEAAQNLKLNEKIVNIFKTFFEEYSTTPCTTFVKRHGEHKKLAVIRNLQLLLKCLLNWHSSPTMVISDDVLALEYSKIIIQIWPWMVHSTELKLTLLQVAAFVCERSLVMCKRFSTINNTSFAHSVLQLTTKLILADTMKIKAANTDSFPVISSGLRVLINCCSSVEGRNVLIKARVTDIFDSLYPFNSKAARIKSDIVNAWLSFWEILSRYDEGAQTHHLNALCSVINRSKGDTRLISLKILRNMSFLNSNRIVLLTSSDFIYTANEIISQSIAPKSSVEEQLAICVALWKLISGGVKFVAMIRGTKLSKQLRLLRDSLKCLLLESNEKIDYGKGLLKVLDIIFKMFET